MADQLPVLRATYDWTADAAYVYLWPASATRGSAAKTVEPDDKPVNLDFDSEGRLVGIEILRARTFLHPEFLEEVKRRT